jgi:hypothetical protein
VAARATARHRRASDLSGPEGNEHLTAMTGAVLLLGFAVEGGTILELHRLLWLHFVMGFLLLGPAALKIGSVLYRFARYYARSEPYQRKGPPGPVLRVLGPLVVCTSVGVLGTGVILGYSGPGNGPWLLLHKATFVLWLGVMTIHVLAYAPRLPRLLLRRQGRDFGQPASAAVPGAPARYLALGLAIAAGVLVAAVTMHLSARWGGGIG